MSEILFIANDPCILALIQMLQPLVEPRISLESDYSSGIKRIFDTHPAVVFLQHKIGKVSCDKLANQVKMLLDGDAIPLILLSNEASMSYSWDSSYEACFDLCLPLDELTRQVQQQLRTLPKIAWKEPAAAEPTSREKQSETMELTLPTEDLDFSPPYAWPENDTGSAGKSAPSTAADAIQQAPVGNSPASAGLTSAPGLEEPQFLTESSDDKFIIEPIPSDLEEAPQQPAGMPASSIQPTVFSQKSSFPDSRRIEKEDPSQLFGSMSGSRLEPSLPPPEPIEPKPAGKGAFPGASRGKISYPKSANRAAPRSASTRQPVARPAKAAAEWSPSGDGLSDSAAATLGIGKSPSRSYRGLLIGVLLVLVVVSALLVFLRYYIEGAPTVSRKVSDLGAKSKAPNPAFRAPVARQLPQFIPQVAPDARYGASHPGWERYQADALEYLIYREKGGVRAIQVLSEKRGAITPAFFKTCIRVSTGQEQFDIKKTETRGGFQVITGALQNGAELVVYKGVQDGDIRGFVLTFPVQGQSAAGGAEATKR